MKYTFDGPKGSETTVGAENERDARNLAMISRWGWPDDKVVFTKYETKNGEYVLKDKKKIVAAHQYEGFGLSLIRVEGMKK